MEGTYLFNLHFADDIILFANMKEELNKMLEELYRKCQPVDLTMNANKTISMAKCKDIQLKNEGREIENVYKYIYPGDIISISNRQEEELNRKFPWPGPSSGY